MLLGDYIQKLRNQRGLSQQEFADKLGIGRSTLANYEQNKRSPDYETLIEISKFFNVSIDELLGVKRKPFDVFKFILKDLSIDKELMKLTPKVRIYFQEQFLNMIEEFPIK